MAPHGPNTPAQAGRASDARLSIERRSRPCLQPVGSAYCSCVTRGCEGSRRDARRDETKHIARLKAVSERIDDLQARLSKPIDPRLAHYLQRKSYDKALELLEEMISASTARR